MAFDTGRIFREPLLDLGQHENAAFAGVLSPRSEVGAAREGVNAVFLENAEDYYQRYQGFNYWHGLCREAGERIGLKDPNLIVEVGCGFGNATLPMLDLHQSTRLVATDISPNLLAILKRLLDARGLNDRCVPVAMDAQKPYLTEGIADCVFGAAILHHLAEPGPFIDMAMRMLKPGASAFFFEPFEAGNAVLRLICQEIAREARYRGENGRALEFAELQISELEPQIFRQRTEGWRDRDDKWAFPRSVLQDLADAADADLRVYPIHDNVGQFRRHFAYQMKAYRDMEQAELPNWAWAIFDRYDRDTFSADQLRDLPMAGCVIFTKREP
ncbi:class I SAM-dependent methyltransferase [Bosea sp. TAF32]|uniref:class I SAM-dependent methyltransferase n=1 Tax=Bosea sp. TAF32 TaxID=3237482 RepID=UPI003F8FFAC4